MTKPKSKTLGQSKAAGRSKRAAAAPVEIQPSMEWVRTRRVFAFAIDYALYALLALILIVLLTILAEDLAAAASLPSNAGLEPPSATQADVYYGLAYYAAGALTLAAALTYVACTLGGEMQATFGMQLMSLNLRRLDGRLIAPTYAIAHALLFVALNTIFTPLILLAPLFLARKQTVHDRLLDTVVSRTG
ncbi:RDD family protein [Nitratireductor soli]|uniref:RDD family protein n=1 Tax=Nitratireductor soli TaxID=1670619 RepID=UPI00065E1E3D|nr:RDD family protein [Nitratireductor soli]